MDEVLIVPTGTANVASVTAALQRAGCAARASVCAAELERASAVVLPGVGSFQAGIARIDELGLRATLASRVAGGRGTLAICLGMQLLCEGSDESPGVAGLAVVPAKVRAFETALPVPQLGWNRVEAASSELLRDGYAYFANSYRLECEPAGWSCARTDYGGAFVSAIARGAVLACQFHPEISGDYGRQLITRWLQRCHEEVPC